jgi:1-deoxy-D-xylulose-5-phosphate synthase
MLLDSINSVEDLRKLKEEELPLLAEELRATIIDVISKNGGHIASSLGVVELTIALHYVLSTPIDKIIWDVGHQSYAHKILTGRRDFFPFIRQNGGISGFPKRSESQFDVYDTGHSSTSLSLALGEAVGRDFQGGNYDIIAVIGDGSMTSGMAFEALNQIGHLKKNLTIILNDNEHSISENVGALSSYLTRVISSHFYNKVRSRSIEMMKKIPKIGKYLYSFMLKTANNFKGTLVPGVFFEEMGVRYFGPIDGHDIGLLIEILRNIKKVEPGPKIIHVITRKGKGYLPAEMSPAKFHGVSQFDISTGRALAVKKFDTYSEVAGKTLAEISRNDKKIVAVTAAMMEGTGLCEFEKHFPDRVFDVGIAEQHAITFSAALASTGMKPFVSIYSTFLQRAVDQLIHDVSIMNLPVKLLIDRAGIVGEDGETHHGLYDIGIIKNIPNFIFLSPSNGRELRDMIYFAADYNKGPVAIRYPRGKTREIIDYSQHENFKPGKIKIVFPGKDIALFALGDMRKTAEEVREILAEKNISAEVVGIQSVKPFDLNGIEKVIGKVKFFITLENGLLSGGAGEGILSKIRPELRPKFLFSSGFPDSLIPHGTHDYLMKEFGLDALSISGKILSYPAFKKYKVHSGSLGK